jgi:predicted GIY-YIG superfamily endonuclease
MGDKRYIVYILRCSDGSLYAGLTSDLEIRLAEPRQGLDPESYTYRRRPLELLWSASFRDHDGAFALERQIKGWSRAKKIALVEGGVDSVHEVVRHGRRNRKSVP